MLVEDLDETVAVRADFSGNQITPLRFRRSARVYRVAGVNARWVEREGAHATYCFSVDVDGDTFFLAFKSGEGSWRLTKSIIDG